MSESQELEVPAAYAHTLAAASSAADVAAELLRATREDDVVDVEEALAKLADAAVNLIALADDDAAHGQLEAALRKWQGEHGY